MSKVVAVQYAGQGIRVNTVVPGQLHTPMVEARLAKQRAGGDVEALLRQRVARIPLGFMGDGRDTANAVWGNKPPILVGDFLFSRFFELMAADASLGILEILSRASSLIAEGEAR